MIIVKMLNYVNKLELNQMVWQGIEAGIGNDLKELIPVLTPALVKEQ